MVKLLFELKKLPSKTAELPSKVRIAVQTTCPNSMQLIDLYYEYGRFIQQKKLTPMFIFACIICNYVMWIIIVLSGKDALQAADELTNKFLTREFQLLRDWTENKSNLSKVSLALKD